MDAVVVHRSNGETIIPCERQRILERGAALDGEAVEFRVPGEVSQLRRSA